MGTGNGLELILQGLGAFVAVLPPAVPGDQEADDSDGDGESSQTRAVRVGTGKKLPTLPRGRYPCCACSQPYVERPRPLLPVGVVQQGKIVEPTPGQAKTILQTPVCPQHAARDIEAKQAEGEEDHPHAYVALRSLDELIDTGRRRDSAACAREKAVPARPGVLAAGALTRFIHRTWSRSALAAAPVPFRWS
jgi:hypothetical protein